MSWFFDLIATSNGRTLFLVLLVVLVVATGPAMIFAGIWLERQRSRFITSEQCRISKQEMGKSFEDFTKATRDLVGILDFKIHGGLQEIRGDISRVFTRMDEIAVDVGTLKGHVDEISEKMRKAG